MAKKKKDIRLEVNKEINPKNDFDKLENINSVLNSPSNQKIIDFTKKNSIPIILGIFLLGFILIALGILLSSEPGIAWKDSIFSANAFVKTAIANNSIDIKKEYFNRSDIELQKLIAEKPNQPFGHVSLGLLYLVISKTDSSINELKEALRLDDNRTLSTRFASSLLINALNSKTNTEILSRDFSSAEKHMNEAFSYMKEPNADLFNLKGTWYHNQNNLDSAAFWYVRALQIDPNHQFAKRNYSILLINQANAAFSINHFEEASDKYLLASRLMPNNSDLLFQIGVNYLKLGKTSLAKDYFNKTLTLAPNNAGAKYYLEQMGQK